ncbi:LysE family translocator [Rhodococcus sp. PSBB049]|uniref:LysE family translocator n=1 Tax=Rhodococcus sp. PSBB049 TaxID=2812863 RepID=UPI0019808596|nr:LysE family translocator [Rhodococcus sp. PSBB049]QSE72436.1 LysE family translocator [Rhodococcus sp. PSBB049]
MNAELLLPLLLYALVTSITPGPNNVMLLASGINYGFVRSIPHMLGISIGFGIMVFAVGLGLGQVFTAFPLAYTVLRFVGAAYLLWLAWRIATTTSTRTGTTTGQPMSFLSAAAFQWVNPKAWVMAIGAITNYTPAGAGAGVIVLLAVLYAAVNGPSVAVWAAFGTTLSVWLTRPTYLRVFNITMAALLAVSLYPLLTAEFA